jgi:hypothetical protein
LPEPRGIPPRSGASAVRHVGGPRSVSSEAWSRCSGARFTSHLLHRYFA